MPLPPVGVLPVIAEGVPLVQKLTTDGAVMVLPATAGVIVIATTLLIAGVVQTPEITVRLNHVLTLNDDGV